MYHALCVQVCALWQQGLQVADEPRCEVVSGKIPGEAFSQACSVCRKQVRPNGWTAGLQQAALPKAPQ